MQRSAGVSTHERRQGRSIFPLVYGFIYKTMEINKVKPLVLFWTIFCLCLIIEPAGKSFGDCICTCVNGVNQPLCTSPLDIPPICPPKICPIEPPSVEPIRPPRIPPIGTKRCWMEQVLNPYSGQYEWIEICR